MYKNIRLFALCVLALMLVNGSIYAQAPSGPWASGIACVNLDNTNAASILLTFYSQDNSTPVLTYSDTIPAGGSKTYFTPSTPPGVPNNFVGSVVVASSAPISCNVNTQKLSTGTPSDPYRIGTSSGVSTSEAGSKIYAPQVMKNFGGWNSYIAVQNTESVSVTVTIDYKDRYGNPISASESFIIPPQSTHIFYQNANPSLPNNFLGAATISSNDGTSKLAVVVNFYNSGLDPSTSQLHSYNGFVSGGNRLYVPRFVRKYYGYNSGLSIQNIGNVNTTIRITFTFAGNTYVYTSPAPIAPGAALALYAPNISEINSVDSLPEGQRFGNAIIEVLSGGPIVAIVNEDNRGGPGVPAERVGQGATYNAIIDGTQTNTIFFPQIPRNVSGVFSGGFQIANTTGTAATCNITYSGAPLANETNVPLPPNGSIARYAPNVSNLPDGFNGSATVTCSQPIVGISNLAVNPGSGRYGDSFTQSNGLNR
jgi:hypothetical protein